MAFDDLIPSSGPFSLAPGASMRVWVWFGGGGPGQAFGKDKDAQWIMADPIDPTKKNAPANTLPAALEVSQFTKVRDYWFDSESEEASLGVLDITKTVVRYEATVRNVGNYAVRFAVEGGGNK